MDTVTSLSFDIETSHILEQNRPQKEIALDKRTNKSSGHFFFYLSTCTCPVLNVLCPMDSVFHLVICRLRFVVEVKERKYTTYVFVFPNNYLLDHRFPKLANKRGFNTLVVRICLVKTIIFLV